MLVPFVRSEDAGRGGLAVCRLTAEMAQSSAARLGVTVIMRSKRAEFTLKGRCCDPCAPALTESLQSLSKDGSIASVGKKIAL